MMLCASPGYVLHTVPYGETSVVAKVFTRELGVKGYIVKGVRSRNGRVRQNMLQPMTGLDMVVYDNARGGLNYVKEMSVRHTLADGEPVGNALRFFVAEVLYKTLPEGVQMSELWDYVDEQMQSLAKGRALALFPQHFMIGVARHTGILPMDDYCRTRPLFSMEEGRYVAVADESTLSERHSHLLHQYLNDSPEAEGDARDRSDMLDVLIAYFRMHMSGFGEFRSHEILHAVLH